MSTLHLRLLPLLLFSILLQVVQAGTLQGVRIPKIAFANHPITVDGQLNDWSGMESVTFLPFDVALVPNPDALVKQLQAAPSSAKVSFCYDAGALYCAISWTGSHPASNSSLSNSDGAAAWWKNGDGIELHIRTDQTVHLASWPTADGNLAIWGRLNDEPSWTAAQSVGITCALATGADKKSYTEEIRIPWTVLTKTGKIPGDGKVKLACDFGWSDLDLALVKQLPQEARHASNFSYNFLTTPGQYANSSNIGAGDWGNLVFAAAPATPAVVETPMGTGLGSLTVPQIQGPLTIDGRLESWKAPFAPFEILPSLIGSRYGGKISAQYDDKNLYIAAHYITGGPLQNLILESTQRGYTGGDCLQIRLQMAGKTVNLCGWYDSTSNKPALTADGADLPQPLLLKNGAQEGFTNDPNCMGYSQTISIPWTALGLTQGPAAGDQWKATFQPWWSGLDPRFTIYGETSLSARGALQVAYDLPADGEVTLGLYNGTRLLRTVLSDEFRTKGQTTESWDGLDQWGKPIPPGSYVVKGIYHPHLTTDYLMSFGNPGNPPWPTPDGKGDWLSDEEGPQGAATDGKWVFLGAPGNELGYSIIGVDETGRRQWGMQVPYNPHTVSLAVAGDYLYVLYAGPKLTDNHMPYKTGDRNAVERDVLLCLDKKTGRAAQFTIKAPQLVVNTQPYAGVTCDLWDLRKNKTFSPDIYTGQPRYYEYNIGAKVSAIGLAAVGNRLYIALHDNNKILVVDAASGEKIGEIPVAKPAGLYAKDEHTLYAVSDKQVVLIDPSTKQVTPVISSGLLAPRCVTSDPRGNLYVSDWGASFQVKIFTPTGSLIKAIGKEGGRPWVGPWAPSGMLVPTGVAVTDSGKLWVAEDDEMPNRVSVWNPDTGALIQEYLGPATYTGAQSALDPLDKTNAYTSGLLYKLDYAAKSWSPVATVNRRMDRNQPFAVHERDCVNFRKIYYHDGHEYHVIHDDMMTSILMRKGDLMIPVAAIGCIEHTRTLDGTQRIIRDDFGYRALNDYFPSFFAGHAGDNYSWADENNDGLVQPTEMHWLKTSKGGNRTPDQSQPELTSDLGGMVGIDPNWNLYWGGTDESGSVIYRLQIKGWSPTGAPIYDIADSKPIVTNAEPQNLHNIYATSEGNVVVTYNYEWGHSPNIMECYDPTGKQLWAIKKVKWEEQADKDILDDAILGEFQVPGLGNVLYSWLWHANYYPHLVTTDGLFVSTVLERSRFGPTALWGESWNFPYQDTKGQCYVINGTNDSDNVFKLNGLDQGGRFQTTLTLTQEDVDRAAVVRSFPEPPTEPKPVLNVSWNQKTPVIDGDLSDWNLANGVSLSGDKGRTARIALARDATNLYLAYEVNKDVPFGNSGSDWQSLFITGDCVDVMLAIDPKAPVHRQAAVQGDERLLMTLYQGKPIAVLYRPVVPGTNTPVMLSRTQIDGVTRLDDANLKIKTQGNTYSVEAAIPLSDLGIDPKDTGTLLGDVGVVFSDETGTNRSQRLYFNNKKTSMVSDLSTEATLQPGEWGSIQFPLGENLLKNGSFESDFTTDPHQGWSKSDEKGGAQARIGDESPHSGQKSLILEQTTPVLFSNDAMNGPDFGAFRKSANNGQGEGNAVVTQTVPVQAGRYYSFRFDYRAENLHVESSHPGPDRGFARLVVSVNWQDANGRQISTPGIAGIDNRVDSKDWQQSMNNVVNQWAILRPYQAPNGAVSATISAKLNVVAPKVLSKAFMDDVEFVEVTEESK